MSHWREGQQRLAGAPPEHRPALERVTGRIVEELRRQLGGPFTAAELLDLYERRGTSWCTDIAYELAPGAPWAWDARTTADAASPATCVRQPTTPAAASSTATRSGADPARG